MVDGQFGEELDRRADCGEVGFGGLERMLADGLEEVVERRAKTYLVGCVEGCHEAGCVGLDFASHILAVLVLLCEDSVEFEEETNNRRTCPRIIGR